MKMHSVLTSLQLSSVHGFSSSHTISTASHSPLVLSHQLFQQGSSGAQVTEGKMGKREFVGSRLYRLAKKVNPATTCEDEESCEIELEEADPALVEMAKQGLY